MVEFHADPILVHSKLKCRQNSMYQVVRPSPQTSHKRFSNPVTKHLLIPFLCKALAESHRQKGSLHCKTDRKRNKCLTKQ